MDKQVKLYSGGWKELNKRKVLGFLCILFFAIVLSHCSREELKHTDLRLMGLEYDQSVDKDTLILLIRNAPQEVNLSPTPSSLWFSPSFLELERLSHELLAVAIELLESGEFTEYEKFAILYATLNVDFDIRKYFVRNLAITFRNGKIDELLMFRGGFFPLPGIYHLMENYKDPVLREALGIILRTRGISSAMREAAQLILSGEYLRRLRGF